MDLTNSSPRLMPCSRLISRICGDLARGMNFDVMSCMPCKAFFRRNALRPMGMLQCDRKYNCEINKKTRSCCAACRLKKCFMMGMNSQLIRSFAQSQLPTFESLDLLRNDRSDLTNEEWNLFSNIIHAYDEQNFTQRIRSLLDQGSSVPFKLRAKSSLTMSISYGCITSIKPLIQRSPYYHSLTEYSRRVLVTQNLFCATSLNTLSINRNIKIWDDPANLMSFLEVYGPDHINLVNAARDRLDPNEILIKLMLFVIIFSSNCSISVFPSSFSIRTRSTSIELIHLQNIFVTLLWKYLVYQFGWKEAVQRYSSLVKSVLDVLSIIETTIDIQVHTNMFENTIKQIEHSLVIDD